MEIDSKPIEIYDFFAAASLQKTFESENIIFWC